MVGDHMNIKNFVAGFGQVPCSGAFLTLLTSFQSPAAAKLVTDVAECFGDAGSMVRVSGSVGVGLHYRAKAEESTSATADTPSQVHELDHALLCSCEVQSLADRIPSKRHSCSGFKSPAASNHSNAAHRVLENLTGSDRDRGYYPSSTPVLKFATSRPHITPMNAGPHRERWETRAMRCVNFTPSAVFRRTASRLSGEPFNRGGAMFYRFETCPECNGERFVGDGPPWELCPECEGDGCVLDVPDKLIEDVLKE